MTSGAAPEIADGLEQRADLELRIDGGRAVAAAPSRSSASTLSRSSTPFVMLTMNGPTARAPNRRRLSRSARKTSRTRARVASSPSPVGRGAARAGLALEQRAQSRRTLRRRLLRPLGVADQPPHHLAMDARVLAHVERRQVKAEGADAARQAPHPEQAGVLAAMCSRLAAIVRRSSSSSSGRS